MCDKGYFNFDALTYITLVCRPLGTLKNIFLLKISATAWALLLVSSAIWGASFILMKRGLEVFPSSQVASLRIVLTFLCLSPFLWSSLKQVKREYWLPIFGVGLTGSGIPPYLFTLAQTRIDSALAGILNALTPLFTFLLGVMIFGLVFNGRRLLGVVFGLLGAVCLILFNGDGQFLSAFSSTDDQWYGIFIVLATICYASSVNLIKKYCQNIPPIALNTLAFLMISPWAFIHLSTTDFLHILQFKEGAYTSLGYIFILSLFGTAIASILFFHLVQMTDALFASNVTYLIPIVAIVLGFLDGEAIGWMHFVGLGCILLGVYFSSKKVPS